MRGGADVDRRPEGFSRRCGCGVASKESQRHVPFCASSNRAVATATARSARPAGHASLAAATASSQARRADSNASSSGMTSRAARATRSASGLRAQAGT